LDAWLKAGAAGFGSGLFGFGLMEVGGRIRAIEDRQNVVGGRQRHPGRRQRAWGERHAAVLDVDKQRQRVEALLFLSEQGDNFTRLQADLSQ